MLAAWCNVSAELESSVLIAPVESPFLWGIEVSPTPAMICKGFAAGGFRCLLGDVALPFLSFSRLRYVYGHVGTRIFTAFSSCQQEQFLQNVLRSTSSKQSSSSAFTFSAEMHYLCFSSREMILLLCVSTCYGNGGNFLTEMAT